jgi:two-component system, OmpR family, phosphate regulon response regulator PhoB
MAQRILIVEDDEALRRMYRTALRMAGYEIQQAADGLHALHLIDLEPPDLVVLDLNLPMVSGFVVQQDIAARAHTRHIPIVIVTGTSENIDQLGLPCVLRKPVAPDDLVIAVRNCLTVPPDSVGPSR